MVIIKTIIDLIKNPRKLVAKLGNKGFLCWLPDEQYLKLLYRAEMGKKLDLKNPRSPSMRNFNGLNYMTKIPNMFGW